MKKALIIIIILAIICGISFYFISKNKPENVINNLESGDEISSGELKIETKNITEEIKDENDVELLKINYEYIEFDTENEYLKTLNEEIKNRAEEKVNDFKSLEEHAKNTLGTDLAIQLPYVYENKSTISYNKDNIIVIEDMYYEESGGPHPNHGVEYHNYDIEKKRELTINDIFEGKTNIEISNIIMEKVKVAYKDYEEVDSFFEMLSLEENLNFVKFAIEEDDILIDLQEFVPYAFGECAVKIEKNM